MGRDARFMRELERRAAQRKQDQRREMLGPDGRVLGGSAPTVLVDRFGYQVERNDIVLFESATTPEFLVADIQPVLHPQAPPGLCTLTLQARFQVNIQAGQRIANMVVVGTMTPIEEGKNGSEPTATLTKIAEGAESAPGGRDGDVSGDAEGRGEVDGAVSGGDPEVDPGGSGGHL